MNRPRLFLSAVSEEFRTARQKVGSIINSIGYDVITQDNFPTGHGELRSWLREQIDSCEGLIQLVGAGYGAEPTKIDDDYGRISYTQFEFLYAYHCKIKTWIIVIKDDYSRDKPIDQLDLPRGTTHPDPSSYQAERRKLQQNYIDRLRKDNHLRYYANTEAELELIIRKLNDDLGELWQKWETWLEKDRDFKNRTSKHLKEIVKATKRNITKTSPLIRPKASGELPVTCNIKMCRNVNFTGRDEYLSKLESELKSGSHAALTQAIRGMGGIGKTQIALEYAYRYSTNYKAIWWIRSENERSLAADYAAFAIKANLPEKDAPEEKVVINAVQNWLEHNQNWLFIFDNAVKPEDINDYLPRGASGHVLITSRHQAWEKLCRSLSIDIWPRKESVEFLINRTKDKNRSSAYSVGEELGDLPLALEQAAAFINETGMSFDEYLELYETRHNELWDEENPPINYPDTVGTTWSLAIEKVQEEAPAGALVLNLCSYFAPDEIPRSMINRASDYLPEESSAQIKDSLALNKGIKALNQYSLVNTQPDSLSVHRLVQVVVRDRLKTEEQKVWSEAAVQTVNAIFPSEGYDDIEVWPECAALLSHGNVVIEQAIAMEVELEVTADLLNNIASYLFGRASYSNAEQLFRHALKIDETHFEPGHPSIAKRQSNLATVLQDLGDLEGARDLLEKALASDQQSFEPGHPSIATSQSNLALVLQDLGDLEGARDLLEKALESAQQSFEPGHPSIARSQSNLATVLKDLGDLEGARDLLEKALESAQQSFEPGHPSIAIRQSNLATVLKDLGDLEGARDLLEKALASDQQSFEPGHPSIAIRQSNLATVLKDLGDLEGARDLLEKALASDQQSFEPGHPSIAISQSNLATVLKDLGDLEGARDLLEKALESAQQSFEPGHPSIAISQSNLATVLKDLGDLEGARDLLEKALESAQQSFEPGHPSIAIRQSNLATVLKDLGDLEEARDLIQSAYNTFLERFGEKHPNTIITKGNLESVMEEL